MTRSNKESSPGDIEKKRREDEAYKQKLLDAWEETYKKGQLTFWVFLGLREQPRYVAELKEFIESATRGTITVEEQSLYRSLRKYRDLEMVDYVTGDGDRGPERKYYRLTPLGEDLLSCFIERNIALLYDPHLRNLIQTAVGEREPSTLAVTRLLTTPSPADKGGDR